METVCFTIKCPDEVLLWLIFAMLGGAVICTAIMNILSKGFTTQKTDLYPDGKPFSIFTLEFPFSYIKFKTLVESMPDKTKKAVRWSLNTDYFFMFFAYQFLVYWAWYLLRNYNAGGLVSEYTANYLLQCCRLLPLSSWILDTVENLFIASILKNTTRSKTVMLLVVSLLKWIAAIFVVISLLYFGITNLFH